jgi:pyruvate dehydrogenase E1 component alpha subunit
MEIATYRYGGHSMSDPGTTYRTCEAIQNTKSTSDPISHLKNVIVDLGVAIEANLKEIDKQVKKTVYDAQRKAEQSPEPILNEFWTDIYLPGSEPKAIRGHESTVVHHYD